ncbi:MAG: trehalose utilization protein ThuA [bacterium]|nr:trehalose utilization protein ThuA [bacterium]
MNLYGRSLILALLAATTLTACCTAEQSGGDKAEVKKATRCVAVWSEKTAPRKLYPNDINTAIAEGLEPLKDWEVVVASIADPDMGLPDELLQRCDVLVWWGHKKHGLVDDALVEKVVKRVREDGMGFISLHSAHYAKPNRVLMDSPCSWGAYEKDTTTLDVTVTEPDHPIAKGVKNFTIAHSERYSEPYAVPKPEAVPFEGVHTLTDGSKDPSRVGLCWTIGKGKFFYFQAGHETDPVYFDENVRLIMRNAVEWAAPDAE